MAEQNDVPAAWYPDQNTPGQLRWWDGRDWTADVRPLSVPVASDSPASESSAASLLDSRHGLHAVAKPAEGFGHATSEQLRGWPPPQPEFRSEVEVPVREIPRNWSTNDSVGAIKSWMTKEADSAGPVEAVESVPADAAVEDISVTRSYGDLSDWQPAAPFSVAEPIAAVVEPPALAEPPVPTASAEPPVLAVPTVSAESSTFADKYVAPPTVEQSAPGPVPATLAPPQPVHPQGAVALTRRQLRELVGGPLTTDVEPE